MNHDARGDAIQRAVSENPVLWALAKGCRVRHGTYGMGTIIGIQTQSKNGEMIIVRFDHIPDGNVERRFQLQALFEPRFFPARHAFPQPLERMFVGVQEKVAAAEEQLRQEAILAEQRRLRVAAAQEAAAREARALIEHIAEVIDKAPTASYLNDAEIEVLRQRKKYGTLAGYYERQYERTRNVWDLIKASGFWRKDGKPEAALAATEPLVTRINELCAGLAAPLLTTRGGAYRDMKDFDRAEKCACKAISLYKANPKPYNLLIAILIQQERFLEAEEWITRVEQLTVTVPEQRSGIEMALRSLDDQQRVTTIRALQLLNPERFAWLSTQSGR